MTEAASASVKVPDKVRETHDLKGVHFVIALLIKWSEVKVCRGHPESPGTTLKKQLV